MADKRVCSCCDWTGDADELLSAPNPFLDDDTMLACPSCRVVTSTVLCACDEPGCWQPATCGVPTPGGYRSTCGKHVPATVEKGDE